MDDHWTARLSEYLDDELAPGERPEAEAHLAACAACRETLDELRRVVARAHALADAGPDADLWPGVAARLAPAPTRASVWHRRVTFTLPQAMAAGLALVLLSAASVWFARVERRPPVAAPAAVPAAPAVSRANFADESYDRAVSDLERALTDGRDRLDPQTYGVIERNLKTIDRAITEARQALEADPGNVYLNNHLASARKKKLMLLRSATALAHSEG